MCRKTACYSHSVLVFWLEASELTVTILLVTLFLSQLHLEGSLISPEGRYRVPPILQDDKALRVKFGINNIVTSKFHSSFCTIHPTVP